MFQIDRLDKNPQPHNNPFCCVVPHKRSTWERLHIIYNVAIRSKGFREDQNKDEAKNGMG